MSGTLTRVVTAAVLIPAVVAVVWWGSTGLVAALTGLVTLLALLEFFTLAARAGLYGCRIWTCLCALALLFDQAAAARQSDTPDVFQLYADHVTTELVAFVFVLGVAVTVLTSRRPLVEALPSIGVSAAGLLFVAYPLSFIVRLHGTGGDLGPKSVLFLLVVVWVGDTAAYFVGRAVGRHLMAPKLSPKKTWEGAVANLVASLLVGLAFFLWTRFWLSQALILAGLVSVVGQVGDLLESAYKRSASVKDSGAIVPGHGGVLDRIDALILAAPVVWYYLSLPILRWPGR
jgi:phosphatidate cytidylyltransferase